MFIGLNAKVLHKEKTIAKLRDNKPWIIEIQGLKYSIMILSETYFDPIKNREKPLTNLFMKKEE